MSRLKKLINKIIATVTKRPVDYDDNIIKTLYHGTIRKLNKGDFLKCNTTFDSYLTKILTGVFATTNLQRAKFFGIRNCLKHNGMTILENKKIYLEKLRDRLLVKFYVYYVDSKGFVPDNLDRGEYVRFNNTKISNLLEFDLANEVENGRWEIYLVNKLPETESKRHKQTLMREYIKSGRYKSVDVLNIIQRQRVPAMRISDDILVQFMSIENHLKLKLSRELFHSDMVDSYHGISHTTRVLFGVHLLSTYIHDIDNNVKKAIYYAAIIHDLGRTNDGKCFIHGENSVRLYQSKIKQYILDDYLQNQVIDAVKYHSVDDEDCPKEIGNSIIFKILKDADALDRGRLPKSKCVKSFLRLDIFKTGAGDELVDFMDKLAHNTRHLKWNNPYKELTDCIRQICNQ